jgi:hypothetical protein
VGGSGAGGSEPNGRSTIDGARRHRSARPAAVRRPAKGGFRSSHCERVVGQGSGSSRDRVVGEGDPHLAWGGRPSTNEFDQSGAGDEAEDEAEGQKAEFARGHPACIPRLVLLRVRDTIARPA